MKNSCEIAQKPQAANSSAHRRSYVPNVDIVERDGDVHVHVDLPGALPDSIKVEFEDGKLSIDAQVEDRQSPETVYLVREYGVGDFHRSFRVANTVDASKIEAGYQAGVLKLVLPKAEEAKPRRIEVRS